ncbi:MAG TPA: hypothetical protein VM901_09410 [Bdellovibrionota bacterium]|jgi:hypothetical protein|nr:hypothetical protein [Bdellovibrionota bacterium]
MNSLYGWGLGVLISSSAHAACYEAPRAPQGQFCSYEAVLDESGAAIMDDLCDVLGRATGETQARMRCVPTDTIDVTQAAQGSATEAWLAQKPTCRLVYINGMRNRACERAFEAWQNAQPDPSIVLGSGTSTNSTTGTTSQSTSEGDLSSGGPVVNTGVGTGTAATSLAPRSQQGASRTSSESDSRADRRYTRRTFSR